jgi:formylglycine-generating enzyme required for sulfatase activity
MYGNVMEWCVDLYVAEAYSKFGGKVVDAPDATVWAGLTKTPYPRVLRGGGYESEAEWCRSAARMGSDRRMNQIDPNVPKSPHWMGDALYVGFRVVSPVREPGGDEKRKWWNADDATTLKVIERDQERKAVLTPGAVNR